jgi:hypothetical protein
MNEEKTFTPELAKKYVIWFHRFNDPDRTQDPMEIGAERVGTLRYPKPTERLWWVPPHEQPTDRKTRFRIRAKFRWPLTTGKHDPRIGPAFIGIRWQGTPR